MRSRIQCQGFLLLTAFITQAVLCTASSAQEAAAPNIQVPPKYEPERLVFCCVSVMCNGSNSYTVVKGMGFTCPGDLWDRVNAFCPNGYTVDPSPVGVEICVDVDVTPIDSMSAEIARLALSEAPRWKLRGYLCYCDGSPGRDLATSGSSYCEALQKARRSLLRMKDPCKRAYLKFCVVESPSPQTACCKQN